MIAASAGSGPGGGEGAVTQPVRRMVIMAGRSFMAALYAQDRSREF
jgi:hypothetical protein